MMSDISQLEENLEPLIKNILLGIKQNPELDTIIQYKKIIKKNVPFYLRSYLTAYLLKELAGKKSKKNIKKPGEKSVFINVGKNRRVYPSDLIQLIAKTGGISKENIGGIKILDNYSFISINDSVANQVVENLDNIEYRGRKLTVNFAKKEA
jgi:hypothetical protein